MTNFEKYKDEILGISRTQAIAINKRRNAPEKCSYNVCSECLLHEGTYCNQKAIFQWLYSEYQEPAPKLTSIERGLCEAVKSGFIARDKDEMLCIYKTKPFQNDLSWLLGGVGNWIEIDENLFQFITWKSNKAWSIEDLLKLEVEE